MKRSIKSNRSDRGSASTRAGEAGYRLPRARKINSRRSISVDPVERYARDVLSGEEIAGPLVYRACERHLYDLAEGKKRGLWWDWQAAKRALDFFPDVLLLAGGESEGKPFKLHCSQKFIIGSLFGWKRKDGYRRFRMAYIEEGKGSGKSPLSAGVGLYMLTADGEERAEVYAAAYDKNQASVIFNNAVAMVKQSDILRNMIVISGGPGRENNLAYLRKHSKFQPITSEFVGGRGKSGPSPHCSLLDEIHEHPSDAMVELLGPTASKWRRQPLVLMTTNAGVYDPESVCFRYHDYAGKVLTGNLQDDEFFAYVCALDKGDLWTDPAVWKKTNPLLGISIKKDYLEGQVRRAEGMPAKESYIRRFNFCEWMESASPFVSPELWAENGRGFDTESLRGRTCYAGLDLSGKNDLTSLVLNFPLDDGTTAVLPFFWTPEGTLRERASRDHAPYEQWVRDGFLIAKPGATIDYGWVAQKLAELTELYRIECLAFDRWRIEDISRELEEIGINLTVKEHGQGYRDMNPAVEAFEDALKDKRMKHGNHPVLTWCVANVKVVTDSAGLRKFDKRKATGRIDGAVALAMSCNMEKNMQEDKISYNGLNSL